MRNRRAGICVVAAIVLLVPPVPAVAQTDLFAIPPGPRRVDLSGSGGFLLSTDWSDLVLLGSVSAISGSVEQVLVRDLQVEPGPVFDGIVTYWEGRYGFRAHGGFASSCLALGGICRSSSVDVNAYMYDVGGSVGLLEYRRGALAWPYVFLGGRSPTTSNGPWARRCRSSSGGRQAPTRCSSSDDPEQLLIAIDELGIETKFALNLGVGTDFRIPLGPASVGFAWKSPTASTGRRWTFASPMSRARNIAVHFGYVHNMRAAAGLVIQFGR